MEGTGSEGSDDTIFDRKEEGDGWQPRYAIKPGRTRAGETRLSRGEE
jgi:hypothetical protein